jgi:hypothetical protein
MSDQIPHFEQPDHPVPPDQPVTPPPPPPPTSGYYAAPPEAAVYAPPAGPIGRIRPTGTCILLCIVTLGIYAYVWWYQTHEEMKRHTGQGIGGVVAVVIAILVSPVMAFLTPYEVSTLEERRGRTSTVSAITGLWYVLGWLILIGPIVWFVKINNALNDYWRSQGAIG